MANRLAKGCASCKALLRCFRYELPGINALNFVVKNCLGGGGVASLRSDPQVGNKK